MKHLYTLATETAGQPTDGETSGRPAFEQLGKDAVRAMRHRSLEAARKMVAKAVETVEQPESELGDSLFRYILSARRQRRPVKAKDLKSLAQQGVDAIEDQRKELDKIAPFKLDEVRNFRTMATTGASEQGLPFDQRLTGDIFPDDKTHRIFLPLIPSATPDGVYLSRTHAEVAAILEKIGCTDLDYVAGTAKDDRKNTVKLTKLLRTRTNSPGLAERVADDRAKFADPDKLAVVISRHPYDVMRMSTGRGWQSCMSKGGMYWNRVRDDMREGTMIAYLVSRNDPEVHDPLSRILFKPYRNRKGEQIYIADKPYGLPHAAFQATVNQFVHKVLNAPATGGKYKLAKGLYPDARLRKQRGLSAEGQTNARQFLREMGVPAIKVGKRIWAWGDVDASAIGLDKLPDLSGVTLYGDLDLSANNLTSLSGFPAHVSGTVNLANNRLTHLRELEGRTLRQLDVRNNNLQSFEGGPARVRKWIYCEDNPLPHYEGVPEFNFMRSPDGDFNGRDSIPLSLRTSEAAKRRAVRQANLPAKSPTR
ncbi:MAG: hypothetical protein Alpg2KO_17720 [Alphaproteobacteria bacterium]